MLKHVKTRKQMSRLLISLFFTFFSIALAATKDNKLATDSKNLACAMEQCRGGICIYICNISDIDFNRYIIESSEIESAYATWLELTKMDYLPQALPNENYEYTDEQTIIKYTWKTKDRLEISFYERENLVGSLHIHKSGKSIVIDDGLHSIINY